MISRGLTPKPHITEFHPSIDLYDNKTIAFFLIQQRSYNVIMEKRKLQSYKLNFIKALFYFSAESKLKG